MTQSFDVLVKTRLVYLGMTIRDLAKELGLSNAHLSAVIRGDKKLPEEWRSREGYPSWFRRAVLLTLIEDAQQRIGKLHVELYTLEGQQIAEAREEREERSSFQGDRA